MDHGGDEQSDKEGNCLKMVCFFNFIEAKSNNVKMSNSCGKGRSSIYDFLI